MAKKITGVGLGGALLLLALFTLNGALATAVTTIVTTTTVDEDNQQCQREIQKRIFPNCQAFLELEFDTADATIMLPSFSKEYYKKHCCEDELNDIDDQCVCYSVRSMVRNMMDTGRLSGAEEMLEMLVLAGKLPVMCKIRKNRC